MTTSRLEAFSDAVLAIIITIMVLELEVPHEPTLHALAESATGLLTYLLSFVYLGIYWNNHHHLFQLVGRVRGGLLWANLHLLFWLSLVPFTTAWMDEQFAPTPVMVYGVNLLLAAVAYLLLQHSVVRVEGPDSPLRQALGRDLKGKISPLIYLFGIIGSLLWVWLGIAAYVLVAAIWLIPDRRMEHYIDAQQDPPGLAAVISGLTSQRHEWDVEPVIGAATDSLHAACSHPARRGVHQWWPARCPGHGGTSRTRVQALGSPAAALAQLRAAKCDVASVPLIPLRAPWVSVVVVAEAGGVLKHQLDAADPLGRFPEMRPTLCGRTSPPAAGSCFNPP